MRFKIVRLGAGLLVSTLLWGEDTENTEALFDEEEESETVVDTAIEPVTEDIMETAPEVQTHSKSLIKNSPFIPFKESKDVLSSVESADLEFLSVVDYASSKHSFCLKDKHSGKSFWIHSDTGDANDYGVTFYQYDPEEKTLVVKNDEGELVSMVQQKPKLSPSSGSGSWGGNSYSDLLRSLEDDDDDDED